MDHPKDHSLFGLGLPVYIYIYIILVDHVRSALKTPSTHPYKTFGILAEAFGHLLLQQQAWPPTRCDLIHFCFGCISFCFAKFGFNSP